MRRYGLLPDVWTPHKEHVCGAIPIASESDLTSLIPPILSQGDIGDCTEESGTSIRYALAKKAGVANPPIFDPLSAYVWERQHDGTYPTDAGSRLSTTVYVAENIGFAPQTKPYDPSTYNAIPTQAVQSSASPWKIKSAVKLTSLDAILECLSEGIPPHLGILIYESFEYETTMRTGIVPLPAQNENCLGGHAIYAVKHNLANQTITIANSWGTGVGNQGYFTLPFDYFRSNRTFMSAWKWVV